MSKGDRVLAISRWHAGMLVSMSSEPPEEQSRRDGTRADRAVAISRRSPLDWGRSCRHALVPVPVNIEPASYRPGASWLCLRILTR